MLGESARERPCCPLPEQMFDVVSISCRDTFALLQLVFVSFPAAVQPERDRNNHQASAASRTCTTGAFHIIRHSLSTS